MADATVWCDGCGVDIRWASPNQHGRHYCCSTCFAGDRCECGSQSERVDERRSTEPQAAALMAEAVLKSRQVHRQLEQSREEERARIARDLHDRLGGALTCLKMDVSRARQVMADDSAEAQGRLAALSGAIDQTIDMVRQITIGLRPAILDDLGFLPAMEWQYQEFIRRTGLEGEFVCDFGNTILSTESATALFRIFQEALTNISRHARATRVEVRVALEKGNLVLQVRDNGCGLAPAAAGARGRLGLVGMRERADMLGGTLVTQSAPGHGFAVIASIPVDTSAPESIDTYPLPVDTPLFGQHTLQGSVRRVVSNLRSACA